MKWNVHVKAILVGVSDYSGDTDTPDLLCSINDLKLMEHALVHGINVEPLNIWIKTERKGFVTRDSFLEGMKLFLRDIGKEDVLLFYFTGHGRIANGKHELLFSDGPLETQSLIDLFAGLGVDKCILFLDCCMSGKYEVRREGGGSDFAIHDLLAGGTAVFAASRPEELSGYHDKYPASVFTSFLWKAMMNRFYLKNGRISLHTIVGLVCREAAAWNARHPDRAQHPVFRSSMGGTVYFDVAENIRDTQRQYAAEHTDYVVVNVSPLHSAKAKRYAVRAVLKRAVTPDELTEISREIVEETRRLDIYKTENEKKRWEHRPADIIFIYFGESFRDIEQGIYAYRVTWADAAQNRAHWYRTDGNSVVAGDMLLWTNPQYGLLRRFYDENAVNAGQAYAETAKLMRPLIGRGEACIRLYQEYRNGTVSMTMLAENAEKNCGEIDALYIALSALPVPPGEMAAWSRMILCTAGDVQEFSWLSRRWLIAGDMSDSDAAAVMAEVSERFYRDLEALRKEEAAFVIKI